jgi:hypothetical protein
MVLTDEIRQDKYPIATLEDQKLPLEESYYAINRQYIVASSTVTGLNNAPYRNDDNSLRRLVSLDHKANAQHKSGVDEKPHKKAPVHKVCTGAFCSIPC